METFVLSNGLRVVHQYSKGPVGHCALLVNAGTRDELEEESGLAHFIEHAIFKGTKKRKAYHILNRLDSVGGEIDAYTTKEYTCFHASFLSEYFPRAIDLISDISLNSQFPAKELEKEKEVVLDEINVYKDSPAELIYDEFESQVFNGHALSNPILGTSESVKNLNKTKIKAYMNRLYQPENMVFSSFGEITSKRLLRILEKHFGTIKNASFQHNRIDFCPNKNTIVRLPKSIYQSHCMMGLTSFGARDPERFKLILLNNILGGPALNSILNLHVREKYGFTYNIESNYTIYDNIGLFNIYLACDPQNLDKSIQIVHRQLKILREKQLSPTKLHLAKQQLKGQLAMARESKSNCMLSQGRQILQNGRLSILEEIHAKIDNVSSFELQELAQEVLNEKLFDVLIYDAQSR